MTTQVGRLASPVEPVHTFNSIETVAMELQSSGYSALPVVNGGVYVGMVTEADLSRALAVGTDLQAPVTEIMVASPPPLKGYESGAQALRLFHEYNASALAVTDDMGVVIGVVIPSRLIVPSHNEARPKFCGGMATPLGVYLTTGAVSGGVNKWGLVLTGMSMFGLFFVGLFVAQAIANFLPDAIINLGGVPEILQGVGLLTFLILLRAIPLSGYHGAEHMVVHAIEQGEPLTPEVVRRMPRVHPRCGTNFAVAGGMFLTIFMTPWVPEVELRLLAAFLVTLVLFRPIGSLVQYYLTTKNPTDKQLAAGIEAGKQLLQNFQSASVTTAGPVQRLWNTGLFHIMAGSLVASILLMVLLTVLNVSEPWRVLSL